jgi:energy-converting hydrogenase Eha subunit H
MIHALTHLNPVAILAVSVLGFLIGGLWYSPLLFVRAWMAEMKITPETMKSQSKGMFRTMGSALLLTLVSTATLATLLSAHGVAGPVKGAGFGLFVGAGLVAAREGTNALFELRTLRHFAIVAGHDVALLVVQGAILAVWR